MTEDILRTPEDRFAGLPDWPYPPHYVDDLAGYPAAAALRRRGRIKTLNVPLPAW